MNMKLCALVVGHSSTSKGAINFKYKINEFDVNKSLANKIQKNIKLNKNEILKLVFRKNYSTLPVELNLMYPSFIVEMHMNAFNGIAGGTEVLYYYTSKRGKQIAQVFQDSFVKNLRLNNRGIKPKNLSDRGGYLLHHTWEPCIITEPLFIDNNKEADIIINNEDLLVNSYIEAIQKTFQII